MLIYLSLSFNLEILALDSSCDYVKKNFSSFQNIYFAELVPLSIFFKGLFNLDLLWNNLNSKSKMKKMII